VHLLEAEESRMTESEKVYAAFKEAGKPLKAGEVAEITGVDKTQVSKIIKSLQKEGKLTSPKRCYYAPS
jgi:DNA-binding transcriptional regulator GbsR (MarR family)